MYQELHDIIQHKLVNSMNGCNKIILEIIKMEMKEESKGE